MLLLFNIIDSINLVFVLLSHYVLSSLLVVSYFLPQEKKSGKSCKISNVLLVAITNSQSKFKEFLCIYLTAKTAIQIQRNLWLCIYHTAKTFEVWSLNRCTCIFSYSHVLTSDIYIDEDGGVFTIIVEYTHSSNATSHKSHISVQLPLGYSAQW